MEFEQALDVTNAAVSASFGRALSDVETKLLRGAWQGQTYEQIAQTYGYSASYLCRDIGNKFWKRLSQALGEPVGKTSFREALERRARRAETQQSKGVEEKSELYNPPSEIHASHQDWGEAIDVRLFYGRTEELTTLRQWILQGSAAQRQSPSKAIPKAIRCRLVALLGLGGIGKTALAVKLAHQIQDEFDYVIWRSLRNAPPLETLLIDLVLFLSNQQDMEASLHRLMHWLRASRCLVILDNVETLLQSGERAGQYRPGYENYGELLRVVGESSHQSCLILTSREKPTEIAMFEGSELAVRSLRLSGSLEAALGVIEGKGLVGTDEQKRVLCDRYGCSPLALKIAASSIQDLFDGEIAPFLEEETFVFNGVRRLLDQHFDRLCDLEQSIMYWLAINREWTSIAELASDLVPPVAKPKLLEALESLSWRSLIEKAKPTLIEKQVGRYTQQPVVMEYVCARLIEQIVTEINSQRLSLFASHALLKTTVNDVVRETQIYLILQPAIDRLLTIFGNSEGIENVFTQLLENLRGRSPTNPLKKGNLILQIR